MSEDEFARALPDVLDTGESVTITRGGERIGTFVPEPRANGAAVNELARAHGVPLAEGEPDPLMEALEHIRSVPAELDGDPWRD